jgi:hypothetical protein
MLVVTFLAPMGCVDRKLSQSFSPWDPLNFRNEVTLKLVQISLPKGEVVHPGVNFVPWGRV